ncbi:WhiB family transcriptional regulator [Aldersonia kunmingensis]|uniref:WhiB family transcriptional regulator n=1 Tax=Aldersonia kunmingensis TaxID=408066 RepID=UPI00082CA7D7
MDADGNKVGAHACPELSSQPRPDWRFAGACQRAEPELFFDPVEGSSRQRWAKSLCKASPVRSQCREHALRAPELDGIWGGLTARERRNITRNVRDPMQISPVRQRAMA